MISTHRKGSTWRTTVRQWLDAQGWVTHTRPLGEAGDDIDAVVPGLGLSVEAKNHAKITLAEFVDQAERQAPAGRIPVVMIKRKGRADMDDGYVVMSGRAFNDLINTRST